ncbi:glycan metabolism protein RagB [Rhodonellum psychrophilum GCM71 = DSM 17998]|uniref:Glycan metabolism protein RagB n=2 Tax=Rhodonellum TaxID=336827 RepID=U5BSK2_9BACT|nr:MULTISPECIES: RagB/SusD family nutrient uptake outer membrane protein [Rhodonellum]ERM83585.1 glycan metabolism protein RagB [Rhodonellum psychrophilum GCM71 = DSM 17998]SDY48856.1 Starch-binding associating with outer membrane [Rhodonellum ikkaensis]
MKKYTHKIVVLAFFSALFSGCVDLLEPAIQNNRDLESSYNEPRFAQGLIINGYARIPRNGWSFNDMATDDAVSNNENNAFFLVAGGQWASDNNPLNQWNNSNAAIQYLNIMIETADKVSFTVSNDLLDRMFADRIKGEAYGLRALFMFHLLQSHGGVADGQLLGVQVFNSPQDLTSEFNLPRSTFEASMQQLYADAEQALELLPTDYEDISNDAMVPEKYRALGASRNDYNRVFGEDARQLLSGRIAAAIRAQAALMAASPAFSQGNSTTWEDAANFAAEIIDMNNGVSGLAPTGLTWYANTSEINNLGGGVNTSEILWRASLGGPSSNLEAAHFPPTQFGNGLLNPTQNLVDAFPDANGYPLSHPSSNYDLNNPYANRDPRLNHFIISNGRTAGPNNQTINTSADGGTNDGINRVEVSTRTGYYMRKLLRQDVNLNPVSVNGQLHIMPRIRYTEIYLIYAEAANEAWGPTTTGGNGYSAYDVIKAIRQRAGIGLNNGDAYLESIKNDQNAMRTLIRNERRLELCFEGFRFWDLRRWDLDLTETARGIRIQNNGSQIINVQNRVFDNHMKYGPIPLSEVLKYSAISQNTGW